MLLAIFAGSYAAYFAYLRSSAGKEWQLKIDSRFSPSVTILIPAHNEERLIQKKLENLAEVSYPREKMEVVLIDDCSTDKTLEQVLDFTRSHPEFPIKVLAQTKRKGKAHALNRGLEVASSHIIIVTDADCFWQPDVLRIVLPYMSDATIGAISGRGVALNPKESWVTRAEESYLGFMTLLRLGESKIHSTIRFEGSLCVYRRCAFEEFDSVSGADDSGTALRVVQNKYRAIFVPEACSFTELPEKVGKRMKAKARRAVHLTGLWLQCLRLLLNRRLLLPKRIAVPEIFVSVFNPVIFLVLASATVMLVVSYPLFLILLILAFLVFGLVPQVRSYLLHGILDQFILFYAVVQSAKRKRIIAWEK